MKQPPEQLPSLISQSFAARLLGYQSISPIKKLISEKKLQTYKLPDSKRIMVDRIELEGLLEIYNPNSEKETDSKG